MTRIVNGWPPNIEAIRKVLPVTERNIFSWDGIIYNPAGGELSPELIAHEEVHFKQQAGKPKNWWKRFLNSAEFRLQQELPAHRAEYQEFCRRHKDRNERAVYLRAIGRRLSHPMYGKIISTAAAMQEIKR